MNPATVSDLSLLAKYAAGKLPFEDFWDDFETDNGRISSPIDLLDISFGQAIDELSRPIDAIRHQAKTVTVGTSRKEEVLEGMIFNLLRDLNFSAKNLASYNIVTIKRVQSAISAVRGYTLYDINNLDPEGRPTDSATIAVRNRGGISLEMKSRADSSSSRMGTKRTIARTGNIYVGLGSRTGHLFSSFRCEKAQKASVIFFCSVSSSTGR